MLLYLSGIGGMDKPSYVGFKSKEYHWKPNIDYRENPHLYKVGRGQQGVLICQPYKSELHIHWRFKTPEQAKQSAQTIYMMFLDYLKQEDFVGRYGKEVFTYGIYKSKKILES